MERSIKEFLNMRACHEILNPPFAQGYGAAQQVQDDGGEFVILNPPAQAGLIQNLAIEVLGLIDFQNYRILSRAQDDNSRVLHTFTCPL